MRKHKNSSRSSCLQHTQATSFLQHRTSLNMRVSLLALAGAAAASSFLNGRNEYDRPDLRGSYWDVSISIQSGRPGYNIRDFSASLHTPVSTQTFEGKCHYSFVPQGTSPPAETDECSEGLKYEWNSKSSLSLPVS